MHSEKKSTGNFSELRKKAEEKLLYSVREKPGELPLEAEHELNVHKVELEMQNEELRDTQQMLEKSLDNYAELFEFAPVSYFILDKKGIILNLNEMGCNLLGVQKAQVIDKPLSIFLQSEFSQDNFYRHRMLVMETGLPQQVECKVGQKGGAVIPVLVASKIVKDKQQHFKYFLSTVTDISQRKDQEYRTQLALKKEQELNELKSRFINTTSHEFRTPLTTILLSAELLEKNYFQQNDLTAQKHFDKIKSAVFGLKSILLDFFSIEKFETTGIQNSPENIELVSFINSAIEDINIKKQAVIYKHVEQQQHIFLDPRLLRICISNVLANAFKYSYKNSLVEITTAIGSNGQITIAVKDKGIGIGENDKPFIFDQFFRAKNAATFEGSGLGLNITKKFVNEMKGDISFISTENMESVFTMTFAAAMPLL